MHIMSGNFNIFVYCIVIKIENVSNYTISFVICRDGITFERCLDDPTICHPKYRKQVRRFSTYIYFCFLQNVVNIRWNIWSDDLSGIDYFNIEVYKMHSVGNGTIDNEIVEIHDIIEEQTHIRIRSVCKDIFLLNISG